VLSLLSPFACAGCSHKARPSHQRSTQVEKCWVLRIFCCNLLCPHLWSLLTCSSLCYVVKAPALHKAGPVPTESKSKASFPSASQVFDCGSRFESNLENIRAGPRAQPTAAPSLQVWLLCFHLSGSIAIVSCTQAELAVIQPSPKANAEFCMWVLYILCFHMFQPIYRQKLLQALKLGHSPQLIVRSLCEI